jgi:enoyl-CoA hydratase/carnithine racemase
MLDAALLGDLERLIDWVEDQSPCDILLLELTSPAAVVESAAPPDIDQWRRWEKLVVRIDRLACITVAAVNGPCVRFWMQLVLACDHRIATSQTWFQVLELKDGYLPGMNIFRLAKYIGIGVARRIVFTGGAFDSKAAADLGMVDEVCDPSELDATIEAFLAKLTPTYPVAAQLARRLLSESFSTAFEQFLGQYLASQNRCLTTVTKKAEGSVP